MGTCGNCKREIRVCDTCGGLLCVEDCPDRLEDGCTCEENPDLMEDEADDK